MGAAANHMGSDLTIVVNHTDFDLLIEVNHTGSSLVIEVNHMDSDLVIVEIHSGSDLVIVVNHMDLSSWAITMIKILVAAVNPMDSNSEAMIKRKDFDFVTVIAIMVLVAAIDH